MKLTWGMLLVLVAALVQSAANLLLRGGVRQFAGFSLAPERLLRPGIEARRLRAEAVGVSTLVDAALRGAREGRIDAREVVRLLLHEPR